MYDNRNSNFELRITFIYNEGRREYRLSKHHVASARINYFSQTQTWDDTDTYQHVFTSLGEVLLALTNYYELNQQ